MTHELPITTAKWTKESVVTFWEYIGQREDLHWEYFTQQVGVGLTEFLAHTGRLKPRAAVLDYGCGPGFLIQHLLDRGVECYGADSSIKAVELANRKYASNRWWKGAFALDESAEHLPLAYFDLITCIETLEHLPDEMLRPVVSRIFQLLKPGGVSVFSTPFNEDLRRNTILCPFCRTEFHKVQHQRSFQATELATLLQSQGFDVKFCRDLDFREFQRVRPGWKDMSCRALFKWLEKILKQWADRAVVRSFPNGRVFNHLLRRGQHLCAVVQRPQ